MPAAVGGWGVVGSKHLRAGTGEHGALEELGDFDDLVDMDRLVDYDMRGGVSMASFTSAVSFGAGGPGRL